MLIREDGSATAAQLVGGARELASASIGYVEARAGLARAAGHGRLRPSRAPAARSALERVWAYTHTIELDAEILTAAGAVADAHRLRAGDAIHLASALTLDEPDLVFATWDCELANAARRAGLAVAP